ncbi:MAG: FAD-dependent oxidoreductase, partial [Microlunatus sp.]|nr:FAD-dependent oxidoreductase [Microlunatus sp.]
GWWGRGCGPFGVLPPRAGGGPSSDEDFRDWLRRHGARPGTLESALVRGMYDLVFAYVDGDRDQPRFAAGLGLFLAGKFFFDYRGSLFWHLQAGMGDVVFAPLYQALRRRGVRFAFFHRLDQLQLDDDHQRISSIMITRTHRLHRPGIDYQPLITFGGLSCFPAEPDLNQMVDPADRSGPEIVELRAGRDFDVAVLAVPPGALAGPCQELATHSPSWRAMIDNVATVATQSVQLWLRPSESELGWDFPAATVSGYRPPFDTYASMTHLLEREQWPVENRPRTLGYFCGSLRLDDSGAPTAEPVAVVRANAARFMDDHAGHFWPAAADQDGFRRDLVVDQYVRANAVGSQRYVQSLPGTQRFRLQVDESGIDNLLLAGDWTNCGLNAGCIEAAVLSGLEAANVILGRSLMDDIAGTWYGVQA